MGVSLPSEVIEFLLPYCMDVITQEDAAIDDTALEALDDRLDTISRRYDEWASQFIHTYFSDISFLAASLVFGTAQATRMKFNIVRESLFAGNRNTLSRIVKELPEFGKSI